MATQPTPRSHKQLRSRVADRLRGEMKSEESKKFQGSHYYEMFPIGVGAFAMNTRT